jgi:hypothetical protein
MAEILEYAAEHELSVSAAQQAILGYTDADLSGALAGRWEFPVELVEAIRSHAMLLDQLPDRRSPTAFVRRTPMLTRSYGVPDGIDQPERQEPPAEWTMPRSRLPSSAGGGEGVLELFGTFLDYAGN